jgi:colanic acid/amylovoran biosynthesis glycosyltransferase
MSHCQVRRGSRLTDSPRIGYLTSLFARPSDTFIRNEVNHLRKLGVDVVTFSIRRPDVGDGADEDVRRFQRETHYLLEAGAWAIVGRGLLQAVQHPLRFARAATLAWRSSAPGLRGLLMQAAYLLEALYLGSLLEEQKIDLLHNHIGENSATVAMLASEFTGIPYSLTIHGPYIFYAPKQWALGEKLARSAFTACISDFCRSQCLMFAPASAWSRIQVVRCSVQPEFINAPVRNGLPSVPHFLCVARLCSEKGQAVLVDAVAQLLKAGHPLQLSLVGDGPGRPALERLIREKNLADNVKLLGWQSSDRVQELLRNSTALVIPSFAEGLPIVAMEALAMRCPVIATNIAAISELVENGESGWLIPPGSVEHLAGALKAVGECPPEKLQAMGERGRQRVLEMHHPERQAEQLKALIVCAAANSCAESKSDG